MKGASDTRSISFLTVLATTTIFAIVLFDFQMGCSAGWFDDDQEKKQQDNEEAKRQQEIALRKIYLEATKVEHETAKIILKTAEVNASAQVAIANLTYQTAAKIADKEISLALAKAAEANASAQAEAHVKAVQINASAQVEIANLTINADKEMTLAKENAKIKEKELELQLNIEKNKHEAQMKDKEFVYRAAMLVFFTSVAIVVGGCYFCCRKSPTDTQRSQPISTDTSRNRKLKGPTNGGNDPTGGRSEVNAEDRMKKWIAKR